MAKPRRSEIAALSAGSTKDQLRLGFIFWGDDSDKEPVVRTLSKRLAHSRWTIFATRSCMMRGSAM
jgi:hypothetical protein